MPSKLSISTSSVQEEEDGVLFLPSFLSFNKLLLCRLGLSQVGVLFPQWA
jgi:hypothetical protein